MECVAATLSMAAENQALICRFFIASGSFVNCGPHTGYTQNVEGVAIVNKLNILNEYSANWNTERHCAGPGTFITFAEQL